MQCRERVCVFGDIHQCNAASSSKYFSKLLSECFETTTPAAAKPQRDIRVAFLLCVFQRDIRAGRDEKHWDFGGNFSWFCIRICQCFMTNIKVTNLLESRPGWETLRLLRQLWLALARSQIFSWVILVVAAKFSSEIIFHNELLRNFFTVVFVTDRIYQKSCHCQSQHLMDGD